MDTEALKQSLLKKFQEVTGDRLQKIQLGVLELEKPESAAAADDVARELHTMKGEARMLGLSAIGQLAHAAEDLLRAAREGKAPVQTAADLLLRACDAVSDLVEDLGGAQSGTLASAEMCANLAAASGHPLPPLKPGGRTPSPKAPESPPTVPAPSKATAHVSPKAPKKSISEAAEAARTTSGVTPIPEGTDPAIRSPTLDRSIRVNVEVLDSMGVVAGNLLVDSARARLRAQDLGGILERFSRVTEQLVRLNETMKPEGTERARLDLLEGDLHLLRDDSFRFLRALGDGNNGMHGNLTQLATHVTEARLVPLASVFEAFPRAVRDMARQQGKEVALAIENPEVGVDKSMLGDVRDALVHLLRNAVDHGLEPPDVRASLGKPDTGRLRIRVRADGELLHLEVEDDGRGIDPERLRQAAISRNLLTSQQALALSEREALDLIFLPGFTTREQVSELSGRGVGMDVVKRKVESLGGSVAVQSRIGRGTTVVLRMPQSLALMRVLLIRLGENVYGIPAADVEAVVRIRPEDRFEVFGTVAIKHRGRPAAMVALGSLLGLNGGPSLARPPAVVVTHGEDRAALVVDGFLDEREVPVKPCGGDFLQEAPFIAGTAALEDGRIAVLLHIPDVMAEVRRLVRPVTQAPTTRKLKVLLVDDSPIARATESALVRALGHTVEEAQDGEEALTRVQAQTYDLILTDVQMPKLDGFALTRRLKGDARFARLPVIILSSLASPEDKRRGVDAGADAYLVKGELGVESLAQAIDRLT
jgi:chemotaxis protein histidine kinase CheA